MKSAGLIVDQRGCAASPEATQQEQSWDGDPPLPPGFCTAGALVSSPPPPFCLAENIYIMKAEHPDCGDREGRGA